MKLKIAIIGCCATRDAFRSDMNPGYKDIISCCFMQGKVSFISLASDFQLNTEGMEVLEKWEQIVYKREMDKMVLNEMIASNPDYIIIDLFADAYFGVNEFNEGQYVTYNLWHPKSLLEKMKSGRYLSVATDKEKYCSLFKNAMDYFINLVNEKLPKTKILFHNIRYATEYINAPEGCSSYYDFDLVNNSFYTLTNIMKDYNLPEINIFEKYNVRGDINHIWGFGGVHFEKRFYREFFTELVDFCIRDLLDKKESGSIETAIL